MEVVRKKNKDIQGNDIELDTNDLTPTQKVTGLEERIYEKADAELDEKIEEFRKQMQEFVISLGGGPSLAFHSSLGQQKPVYKTRPLKFNLKKGATTSTYEVDSSQLFKQFTPMLRELCQSAYRHRKLNQFMEAMDTVGELRDEVDFLNENAHMNP